MPAVRLSSRRRRSSLAMSALQPIKPGIYGIGRPVTFAPNVTPVTFEEPDDGADSPEGTDNLESALFPPAPAPTTAAPTRRRLPPGKRPSQGYIPRPPNAFMLFRADFVRQKHVPGSIETNHGSLSKIIGNCWRALPLEDKKIWEQRAKLAKAEHKARYPNYRFRPVHNKNKEKKKEKQPATREEERRCEKVAQLLLEGKKGDELVAAFKEDLATETTIPSFRQHRRSSSVPLPNNYYQPYTDLFIPSLTEQFNYSRPPSPLSRQQRLIMGQRRASSAAPLINRGWTLPLMPSQLTQDHCPLPEPDTSLFEPFSFNQNDTTFTSHLISQYDLVMPTSIPPHMQAHQDNVSLSPLDTIPQGTSYEVMVPHQPQPQPHPSMYTSPLSLQALTLQSPSPGPSMLPSTSVAPSPFSHPATSQHTTPQWVNMSLPIDPALQSQVQTPAAYSGSPISDDLTLTPTQGTSKLVHVCQPQPAQVNADDTLFTDSTAMGLYHNDASQHPQHLAHDAYMDPTTLLNFDPTQDLGVQGGVLSMNGQDIGLDDLFQHPHHHHHHHHQGYETDFGSGEFGFPEFQGQQQQQSSVVVS